LFAPGPIIIDNINEPLMCFQDSAYPCSSTPSAAFSEDSGPSTESADVGSVASISAIFALNFSRKERRRTFRPRI
jgi:hypothetical protein